MPIIYRIFMRVLVVIQVLLAGMTALTGADTPSVSYAS